LSGDEMKEKILFEACVDSLESSIAAQDGGADRIELCSDLLEGGITPSSGLIDSVCRHIKIPIMAMIRPRGGDFLYTDLEFEVMKKEIEFVKKLKVEGVVFGILKADGTVDKTRTKELVNLSRPLKVTFHRAFDMTRDPFEAIDDLIEIGIERVLTSGQEIHAYDGVDLLKKLSERGGKKIIIMPGGGVDEANAAEIILRSGVKEIHASARKKKSSLMEYRNLKTTMSDSANNAEYELMVTSAERIRAIREAINNRSN
jgi:copper homeostasis protein